jgi:hypothetical protein
MNEQVSAYAYVVAGVLILLIRFLFRITGQLISLVNRQLVVKIVVLDRRYEYE